MATIIANKDKDGNIKSYRLMACVGRDDVTYKQIWRTKTISRPEGLTPVKERKEVERIADAWEIESKAEYAKTNSKIDKSKITYEAFVKEHWWKDHVMDGKHTPQSISFFEYTVVSSLEYFGAKKKLAQITVEDVKRYINYMRTEAKTKNGKPYRESSIMHHFSTMRNVLEYARRLHYITLNPCQDLSQRDKPRKEKQKVDFLTPEEAKSFMRSLESEPLYWRCLMNILITTGLRRGECVALQWGDIDSGKLRISVTRNITMDRYAENKLHIGNTKTGESRSVPISKRLNDMLLTLKAEQEEKYGTTLKPGAYIFCRSTDPYMPLNPTEPTRWQAKFTKKNGLHNVSPHDLRHTAATLALESGADLKQVQELLGHKDASTTLAFYTGITEEQQRKTVEGIESIIG